MDRTTLVDRALEAWIALARALLPSGPQWLELDLTLTQLKALFSLAHAGHLTIGGLAQLLGIGVPAASILVERLVRQGLAQRREDPQDRRRTLTHLTPRGEELVMRLQHGRREQLRRWLEHVPESDLAALVHGLRAVLTQADGADQEASRETDRVTDRREPAATTAEPYRRSPDGGARG